MYSNKIENQGEREILPFLGSELTFISATTFRSLWIEADRVAPYSRSNIIRPPNYGQ